MLDFPAHIEIELTNVCQLSCGFCPHHKMKRKQGFMSWNVLERVVKEAKGNAKTCYMHQIGEPLLHKDLIPMINYVSGAGLRTSISTNAMLLDDNMIKALFASRLDELTLALDSLDKETYEKLRVGGDFERVVANIDRCIEMRRLRDSGPSIQLQMILMKENWKEGAAFQQKYALKLDGIGELLVKDFSTFAGHVDDVGSEKTPKRISTCGKLHNSIGINWNGDIVLCCRDYDSFTVVGNVLTDSISDVWHGAEYERYRKEPHEFCVNC